ncbi:hypothetical protein SAMN05421640_3389 [Ekhidna lutea]|uniref:Uncharacterized protein n=1 Tax=Ekhidna lutea TaxID=447679 RepID=A0A239LLZ1_EKHLU|nr:hypothetical protein [Ekhidna lutea]SNT31697.1 hypothetical protein SAMN05421640_3389 [Ekhidna lutea]
MDSLKHDWLTEGLIDYEYKKYILLAYLKDVGKRFNQSELYPFMTDLIFHYRNLIKVRESKKLMYDSFPETLTKADFNKLRLTYDKIVNDDEVMQQIEEIISFAIPKMKGMLEEGKELYEFVEENINLEPVGLSPIYSDEGYLFINHDASSDVSIYRYQMTLFEHAEEKYRSMATEFLMNEMKGLSKTYENIKVELTRQFTELPNPATYLATTKLKFPLIETVLPVAKRMLVREISVS